MGGCISKCRPRKRSIEECYSHVQDKLVISQVPPKAIKTPNNPTSNRISPCPPSPTTSPSSSVSSFTCSNYNTTSTCSSVSTNGSSILSSKDRSFSNEFLWSCVKENPHIIHINSIMERAQFRVPCNVQHPPKLDLPATEFVVPPKKSTPQRVINASTPQKRVRSSSPTTLTQQKSFRREPEMLDPSLCPISSRILRSPSPSRRFNGDSTRGIISAIPPKENGSRRFGGPKVNSSPNATANSYIRKESMTLASPCLNSGHLRSRNRETCIHRISSKIDELAVHQALAQQDTESIPMEDIDNPLFSLDCFIFI